MKFQPPARPVRLRLEAPRSGSDCIAVLVFILGGVFLLWYEVYHILPTYYSNHSNPDTQQEIRIHYAFAIFFAVNIYGNMFKVMTTDCSKNRYMYMSSSLLPDGWRYCPECDLNLPPRSHHCKICDTCILKRDHHCWFAGCCIGYHNHRYYVAMVTHMVIAGLYCNIFNLSFVVSVKGHLTLYTFLSYIGPHFGWMFGYYDLYTFAITGMTSVGTVLLFLFSWLLYIQVTQIIRGGTQFECKKNIKIYNLGLRQNIREILGKRWYFVLLFPWIPSPLLGTGNQFIMKNN